MRKGGDGALTTQSRTRAVPPARNASMQSPPARACPRESGGRRPPGSSSCRRCWLGPARGGAQIEVSVNQLGAVQDAGTGWLAGTAQHWPPGGGHRRRRRCGRDGRVVASFGCSWSGVGFVSRKPSSQKHRRTFSPLQYAATPHLFGGFGLTSADKAEVQLEEANIA